MFDTKTPGSTDKPLPRRPKRNGWMMLVWREGQERYSLAQDESFKLQVFNSFDDATKEIVKWPLVSGCVMAPVRVSDVIDYWSWYQLLTFTTLRALDQEGYLGDGSAK